MIFKYTFVLLSIFFLPLPQSIADINNYFNNVQYIKPQNENKLNKPFTENQRILYTSFIRLSQANKQSEPALRNCNYLTRWGAPNPSAKLVNLVNVKIPALIKDISSCSSTKHGLQLDARDVDNPQLSEEEAFQNTIYFLLLNTPVLDQLVPPNKKDDLNFCIRYEADLNNTYELIISKLNHSNTSKLCDTLGRN